MSCAEGAPWGRDDHLTHAILRLAGRGVPRVDFLRGVCRLLLEKTPCTAAEIWMTEGDACARCRAGGEDPAAFDFRVVPCETRAHPAPGDDRRSGCTHHQRPSAQLRAMCPALLSYPLTVGEEVVGSLHLGHHSTGALGEAEAVGLRAAARTLGIALVNQRAHAALRERVKELTCLYRLSQLAERPGISLEQMLQGVAELLPPAWQYPEITVGRLELDGGEYLSSYGAATADRQQADIVVGGRRRGRVEILYTEARPALDEGPFLKEERSLLNAVAREVALIIERRQAAEERARLEAQLLHADRLATIGQLAAGVAHELNEPLGAILGFAQLAHATPGLPPSAAGDVGKIEAAALHAREIVRKLMLFARQTPPQTCDVDLNATVRDGLFFLEARCAKNDITLTTELAPALPTISADPSQLQQVLVNLVVNAIQAMPKGGRLGIGTSSRDGRVVLRVADTGIGMSEETRAQAFLPFFTTKDVNEGTGLGLAVVHGIVSAHSGTILLESEEGVGTTVTIELPVESPDPPP